MKRFPRDTINVSNTLPHLPQVPHTLECFHHVKEDKYDDPMRPQEGRETSSKTLLSSLRQIPSVWKARGEDRVTHVEERLDILLVGIERNSLDVHVPSRQLHRRPSFVLLQVEPPFDLRLGRGRTTREPIDTGGSSEWPRPGNRSSLVPRFRVRGSDGKRVERLGSSR